MMKTEDVAALAADFETMWQEDFALLPDRLAAPIRALFEALDALNEFKPSDRRLTWATVSIQIDKSDLWATDMKLKRRGGGGDVVAALAILARVPDVEPDSGDDLIDFKPFDPWGRWIAHATPRVEFAKWNEAQALHLLKALEDFNQNEACGFSLDDMQPFSMDEIMVMAHAGLNAIRNDRGFCDAETAMEVEGFCERWQNFEKELEEWKAF